MSELDRLLSALGHDPADELLWLAVADCLEENGEPARGELLRHSRRLRGMPEDDERWRVEDRVRELVNGGVRPCVPDVTNSIGMRLALVPAGTFWMGSPEDEEAREFNEVPCHKVTLTRPYWMGVFQVTQAEYLAITGHNPSGFAEGGQEAERVLGEDTSAFPVETVSWIDATAFCKALSRRPAEKMAGRLYHLPTEAEWEYACRAGLLSGAFHTGDTLGKSQANFGELDMYLARTRPVGGSPPNAFGLYDMHGNVWEWCADWLGAYPVGPATDPRGPERGTRRVVRGGCCCNPASSCRAAFRNDFEPGGLGRGYGFRVACDITSTPAPRRAGRRTAAPPPG
jgi:uncharacterized protein (TIGR02996 family)